MINPMDLSGKNIMVTGASSGIGKGIALSLSKIGANVIMVARNEERLEAVLKELEPGNHSYFLCDLSVPAGIGNLMDSVCGGGLKLNGLVHSAGIAKTVPLQYLKLEDLHNIMSVNLYSFEEDLKKRQIMGIGEPVDVANAAAFLLSDAARFITGTSIIVDGGYLAH